MVRPKVNSESQKQLDKAQENFDNFETEIKSLTLDRMNEAPVEEIEPQTKLSSKQFKQAPEIYLKPNRTIERSANPKTGAYPVFNEKFRKEYEFQKQMVRFTAENVEIVGESITMWTAPFSWMPAEEWILPVNKPVWGPRYLAEKLRRCSYHRLHMDATPTPGNQIGGDGNATYFGQCVVDRTVHRLNAHSAPKVQVSMNRLVSNF